MSYLKYYDKSIKQEQPQLGAVKLFALPVEYWDETGRYEFKRFKLSMSAKQVTGFARECSSSATGIINAPVRKGKNLEYVALWKKGEAGLKSYEIIEKIKALTALYALDELQ